MTLFVPRKPQTMPLSQRGLRVGSKVTRPFEPVICDVASLHRRRRCSWHPIDPRLTQAWHYPNWKSGQIPDRQVKFAEPLIDKMTGKIMEARSSPMHPASVIPDPGMIYTFETKILDIFIERNAQSKHAAGNPSPCGLQFPEMPASF